MKESKESLENTYKNPDPWGYQTNPEDIKRKQIICETAKKFKPSYFRALDLGAGEGFVTQGLPAILKFGYEFSDNARKRMLPGVEAVLEPHGKYDLVIATGVLYGHYAYEDLLQKIKKHASEIVLTCNVKEWSPGMRAEVKEMEDKDFLENEVGLLQLKYEEFPYRNYTQRLRVFRVKDALIT